MFTKPAGVAIQVIGLLFVLAAATMLLEQTFESSMMGVVMFLPAVFFLWLGRKTKKR